MVRLDDLVEKTRSKNAGPFWLTVDIFCGSESCFDHVSAQVETAQVAALFATDEALLKRFDIPSLNVIKFSLPRPVVQGTQLDRDMHGAQWGVLIAEMEIEEMPGR